MSLFSLAKPILHAMDPETAHGLTIKTLQYGLSPKKQDIDDPRLKAIVWGRNFPSPLGMAAGFDKNASVIAPLLNMGFGFVEVGTVTPKPQEGNPKPRIFRSKNQEAVINRMGFPNQGVSAFKTNIEKFLDQRPRPSGIVGINIGMNKTQKDPGRDYCYLVRALGGYADYLAINISSPNTPGLRDLQKKEYLTELLNQIFDERKKSCGSQNPPPLLVKLAPDLDESQCEEIAETIVECGVDGLILTNTTLGRPDTLPKDFAGEQGGLSGLPLAQKSTEIIRHFYQLTKGKIPIIGVGGISSAESAYEKICAGASLVQLYSGLVFQGPDLIDTIHQGLIALLEKDGHRSIKEATGSCAS